MQPDTTPRLHAPDTTTPLHASSTTPLPQTSGTTPLPQTAGTTARLRASDTEREHVAEILRAAMTEGRLDLAEGEERLAQAYAAVFRDELRPLTGDLPDGGRRALAATPAARAATRRSLQRHASFILITTGLLVGLWLLSHSTFFWPVIPIAFLVMGWVKHARYGRYRIEYTLGHHAR